ncbi:MAG: cysteine desulfurase family protein [Eubacteriales bacterium]|jgi:cysteine desulfurase|nr:cysteine desulfurase family protein [Eubacteriales bacterium]MDD4105517.1 cysteine desulfurase family protein [Eubacteriales bacterium]MDD4710020.1 cysteine desulfurase family protein [Eubacteriales bacterium]NLO15935.1 cysteine desulfurase [Clostridiales bacterium]
MCYLDNSATTRPSRPVVESVTKSMTEGFYNPSALYSPAVAAEKEITACRKLIRAELNADSVVFVSGGTEANNLAILGTMLQKRDRGSVLFSAVEHPSVREACLRLKSQGHDVKEIPVDARGIIDLEAFQSILSPDTRLICVMHVNNETGAVQPIGEMSLLRQTYCPQALLHVDGVQGFLRVPLSMTQWNVDSYSLSAHKIHGPKGIGALALRGRKAPSPLMLGGGQEGNIRSGTENTPGIAGLQAAVENYPLANNMHALKMKLFSALRSAIPAIRVNGPAPDSPSAAPHILNVSFPPVRSETMLHALETKKVYVGIGSACSTRKKQTSTVLSAMNVPADQAQSAIRFSLNPYITEKEIDFAADACAQQYSVLCRFERR